MAFPVYQSVGASTANGALNITKPTGLAVGDLMLAWVAVTSNSNHNASLSAPDGTWTTLRTQSSGSEIRFGSFWKIATSSDVAASTFAFGSGDRCSGMILRVTGHDPSNPIDSSNDGTTAGVANLLSNGITPQAQALFIILLGSSKGNNGGAGTFSAEGVANNNPSWTSIAGSRSLDTQNDSVVRASWANETGNPNTATGNATATGTSLYVLADIQIIAVRAPQLIVTSLILTTTINTPIFVRKMIVTSLHAIATIGTAIQSVVTTKWKNVAKSSATWHNTNKS